MLSRTTSTGGFGEAQDFSEARHLAGCHDDVAPGGKCADAFNHGHADIALLQRARVVQTIAHHHHRLARRLQGPDE